jgi:hypothetical protein
MWKHNFVQNVVYTIFMYSVANLVSEILSWQTIGTNDIEY